MDRIPLAQASLLPPVSLRRSSASAATTASTPPNSATKFRRSRCYFSSRPLPCCPRAERFFGQKFPTRTDYEGELGVVIARRCHQLADSEDVRPYILGYTCVNDFTARDLQKKEPQWVRGKGFDTFCPVGPVVADGINSTPGPASRSKPASMARCGSPATREISFSRSTSSSVTSRRS